MGTLFWLILGRKWQLNPINEADLDVNTKNNTQANNSTIVIAISCHIWQIILGKRENNVINDQETAVDSFFMSSPTYPLRCLRFSTLFSIFTMWKMFRKSFIDERKSK